MLEAHFSVSCAEANNMPKKRRSWCLPIEPWAPNSKPELQNMNRVLQIWTIGSNSQPWAPIINRALQLWTLCSTRPTPKFTKTSKLNWTVQNESQQCPNTLVIFYYILLDIRCILFLLYIILYYMYFIFIICYFILYKLP